MKRYFITGIDTNVGKTVVSAILVEALQADYWKPIQCGITDGMDVNEVRKLISNSKTQVHSEAYVFAAPVSPHLAAAIESKKIEMKSIVLPSTTNNLIIEGAGGMMVPLSKNNYVIQLARELDAEVILVVRNYIGCINHSLLSIDYLLRNKYKIKGMILNGNFDPLVEQVITTYSDIPVLAKFPEQGAIDKVKISELASLVKKELFI
ncbi:MAG: dethiobiotin synthase [Bacteroidia bacterium]|jgi:dethiobiotin synthetase|nr:dethiobiotin synthase [Sphingobacteriaceae bacterium]MBK7817864.1 dethiobiotin synthase [Sphingobacteriaceae bacterium]MBP9068801.1 dethiobiotin synthase [Bacteroidia bacterium]